MKSLILGLTFLLLGCASPKPLDNILILTAHSCKAPQ